MKPNNQKGQTWQQDFCTVALTRQQGTHQTLCLSLSLSLAPPFKRRLSNPGTPPHSGSTLFGGHVPCFVHIGCFRWKASETAALPNLKQGIRDPQIKNLVSSVSARIAGSTFQPPMLPAPPSATSRLLGSCTPLARAVVRRRWLRCTKSPAARTAAPRPPATKAIST